MARVLILLAFVLVLGVPFAARQFAPRDDLAHAAHDPNAVALIIVTPHIEQIRLEFAAAFDRWHRRTFGRPVRIDWRQPGGTTEIRKQLEAQAHAAFNAGQYTLRPARPMLAPSRNEQPLPEAVLTQGAMEADIFFGGGSYEHNQVKKGIEAVARIDGKDQKVRIRIAARPAPDGFDPGWLERTYIKSKVGVEFIYDPDQYWFGAALSGFGICFNRDLLQDLGLPEPASFADLTDDRYAGLLAMADPRQSGSVATLYDSILNREGWDRGWRILLDMSANARYFSASSIQPPMDVGQGDAAAGVAIDFYGRAQAQALVPPGADPNAGRMGYIDPPGATYVDADPVTILAGCREPQLARRFVEFILSDEGQALWQFAPTGEPAGRHNPPSPDYKPDPAHPDAAPPPMGPERYRLRRMPVRPDIYTRYADFLTDKASPFDFASSTPIREWRDAIGPIMGAFAIDSARECRAAWAALIRARRDPSFPPDRLAEMDRLFHALPDHPFFDDAGNVIRTLPFTEANYKAIAADVNRWRDPIKSARAKVAYTRAFRANFSRILDLARAPVAH